MRGWITLPLIGVVLLATWASPRLTQAGATLDVINLDGANEGFNDPTPVTSGVPSGNL